MARDHVCISAKIMRSARFLTMSVSARLLYYDLIIDADDDGVVEGFAVIRVTGANTGDLQMLVDRGFVMLLHPDEMITYVKDWHTHNSNMRADRKIDSQYQSLLLKVVPNAPILKPKPRADTKKKTGRPMDVHWTSIGPHNTTTTKDNTIQLNNNNNNTAVVDSVEGVEGELLKELREKYGDATVDDALAVWQQQAHNVRNPGAFLRRACTGKWKPKPAEGTTAFCCGQAFL